MKNNKLNTVLLLICIALLSACVYGIYSRPTLKEIDARIMHWEQHFGAHFSQQKSK